MDEIFTVKTILQKASYAGESFALIVPKYGPMNQQFNENFVPSHS
jgi:hypothetical protein